MQPSRIHTLTKCALTIALSTALSFVTIRLVPNGGSVTLASMAPILFLSYRYPLRWSLLAAAAYGGIQMLTDFHVPPVQDFLSFALVVGLDYLLAFGVLGLAGTIAKPIRNRYWAAAAGTAFVLLLRYACHVASGILIWDSYTPPGQPVWLYSLVYNATYMLPELVLTVAVMLLLVKYVNPRQLSA